MKPGFILTPSASRDLDGILECVFQHAGVRPALRVQERLHAAFAKLASYPGLGHTREDLADESLRVWAVFSYLVIYRPDTTPLQILRVIHGARDIPRALQEDG